MWPGPGQGSTSMGAFKPRRKSRSGAPTRSPPAVCFSSGQGSVHKDSPVLKHMLQLIAPEVILNLLLLFTGISFGLGCSLGCAPVLVGRAAWPHLGLFLLNFFAIDNVKVGRFAADLH